MSKAKIIYKPTDVAKAESTKTTVPKTSLRTEIGQTRVINGNRFIEDQSKTDLSMSNRFYTYDNMYNGNDCIYNSVDLTNLMTITSLYHGEFIPGKSNSNKSKIAAEFLNYNIRNMSYGTFLKFLYDACTDLKNGFSIQNIVVEKRKYGPYKGAYCLRKLAPRDQKSIYGWVWDKNLTELKGCVQKPRITNSRVFDSSVSWKDGLYLMSNGKVYECDYPFIKTNQMLHFTYNSTNNNPQGDSPLNHCYSTWMELELIRNLEISGLSKDLGGMVVLRVPSELIQKANDKENYPEAYAEYIAIQQNAADLHTGANSFILLTSDTDEKGNYFYDLKLAGVDGGGKQYSTEDIINQKRRSLYNIFGCSQILLGQDSVGSYALSNDKASIHSYYVEKNLLQKCDVLDSQLVPRLLSSNGIYLNYYDMPTFAPKSVGEQSKDEISKVIQRIGSVLKLTPKALEKMYMDLDLPIDGIEDLDFDSKGGSRSGDGMATAGEGTSNSYGGKNGADASVANNENSMLTKNLVFESEDDSQVVLLNTNTGSPIFIDK